MPVKPEENIFTEIELNQIRQKAFELGFSNVQFVSACDPVESWQKKYREYLKKGYHASMKYLENTGPKFSIKKIYEPVKTIAVFSLPYIYNESYDNLDSPISSRGMNAQAKFKVAKYALGRDYHIVAKEKLEKIISLGGSGRIVCDTTPLPERYYAALAGIGFIGKNAMIIHPEMGSYFFLAFILFNRSMPGETLKPEVSPGLQAGIDKYCGTCDKCIKACPGGALDGSGLLNAQRCYSFWSIENKLNIIQAKFRKMDSVFGCDICQDVCPYNSKPLTTTEDSFRISDVSRSIMNGNFVNLFLKGTPYERTGIKGLTRNFNFIKFENKDNQE